jgi:hypothetical protein
MRLITICVYATLIALFAGCKEATPTTNDASNNSMENIETKLEALCLNSQNDSITFSINTTPDCYICNYDYKYLGLLQVNKRNFEVLQKTVLSGQNKDSLRASVSLRFFENGNLYGEYLGLNNFYSIRVSSNTICIYNSETKSSNKFEIKDSIPEKLLFPYNDNNSSSTGDLFYFKKY